MKKKEDILLIVFVIVLLVLNMILIISKELINSNKVQTSEDKYITLSRISGDKVTQGAVVSYVLNINKNVNIQKSNLQAVILNSINTVVNTATILEDNGIYTVYIDTSILPAGVYKVKIPKGSIVFEDGSSSNVAISEEEFSVILIEEKIE